MQKFAASIEYDGSRFHGWQVQKDVRSVQAELEKAISRVADHRVSVVAAGRTDTGVHATGQIVHFYTHSQRRADQWLRGSNCFLCDGIAVQWVVPVDDTFHARFSARRRSYRYVILNRAVNPGLWRQYVSWEYRPLQLEPMQHAARWLLGHHDFSAFRASSCQAKSPLRTIESLDLGQRGQWFWIDIKADAFLQHMVRNIAGVLCRIGAGEAKADWAGKVLQARDRRLAGITASPDGLYLSQVDYDQQFTLPDASPWCRFW